MPTASKVRKTMPGAISMNPTWSKRRVIRVKKMLGVTSMSLRPNQLMLKVKRVKSRIRESLKNQKKSLQDYLLMTRLRKNH